MAMKKPSAGTTKQPKESVKEPTPWLAEFPLLWEFLTETCWDDGTARKPGTILVSCEDGSWKLWVHDRALRRNAWCQASTIEEALADAEAGLQDDSLHWRQDKR